LVAGVACWVGMRFFAIAWLGLAVASAKQGLEISGLEISFFPCLGNDLADSRVMNTNTIRYLFQCIAISDVHFHNSLVTQLPIVCVDI